MTEAHSSSGTGGPAFGKLGPVRRTGPSNALPIRKNGDGIFAKPYDRPSSKAGASDQRDSGVFTRLMDMMKGVMSSIFAGNSVNEQFRSAQEPVRLGPILSLPEPPIQSEAPVTVSETGMQVEPVVQKKSASVLLSELILDNRFRRSKVATYRQIALFFEAKGTEKMTRYEADQAINILKRFVAPSALEQPSLTTPAQSTLQSPIPPAIFRYTDTAAGLASRMTTISFTNTTAFDTPVAPQPAFIDYQSISSAAPEPIVEARRVFSARFDDVMDDSDGAEGKIAKTTTVFIPKTIEPSLNVKHFARPPIHPLPHVKSSVDEQIIKNLQAFIPPKPPAPIVPVLQEKPNATVREAEKAIAAPLAPKPTAAIPKYTIIEPKPIESLSIEPPKTKFDFGAPLALDAPLEAREAKVGSTTATILDSKPAFNFGGSAISKDESVKPYSLGFSATTDKSSDVKKSDKPFSFGFGKPSEIAKPGFSFGQAAFGGDVKAEPTPQVKAPFELPSANQATHEANKKPTFGFLGNNEGTKKETDGGAKSLLAFSYDAPSLTGTLAESAKQSAASISLLPAKVEQKPATQFSFSSQPVAPVTSSLEPAKPSPFSFGQTSQTVSNTGFTFGSPTTAASEEAKPVADAKPPSFTLPTASDSTQKPFSFGISQKTFTFGQTAADANIKPAAAIEHPKPSVSFSTSSGDGAFGKTSIAVSNFGAPQLPTTSGFSFAPSEPPKVSSPFGQPATATAPFTFSAPPAASNEPAKAPTFTFGSTSAAPPALPSFGSAATIATPSFSFGASGFVSANQAVPATQPATSPPAFSFPAPPSSTTPAFSFAPPAQTGFQFGQADPNALAGGFSIGSDPSPSGGSRKISTPVTRRRPR